MTKKFVLDCSVAMTWCLEDETCKYGEAVLDSLSQVVAIVPLLWHIEIANTLYLAKKRNRISANRLQTFLRDLDFLSIETDCEDTTKRALIGLSMEYDLTAYDVCYLNLCLTRNLPLATLDKKLANALLDAGGRIYMDTKK